MFDVAMTLLLKGEFVCEVRYPDAYRFLSVEAHQKDVNAYLARIGRTLATTEQGGAWYAVYDRINQDEKRAIKEEFTQIKQKIRFLVEFFVKSMRATSQEVFYSRGDKIEAHALMAAIDGNPGLRAEFQALGTVGRGGATDGKMKSSLDRQLTLLVDLGYLIVSNAEREIYQVTGKIEYLTEIVQFLMATDNIPEDIEDEPETTAPLF
ncbi:condensin complex protein MksE [Paraburkholderia strydomiana]|uniref:condensin complex protein MksE n=1 Tax=Paraburkholderia strydomiana TaxID=1245417 RepID=UPI0038B9C177